jgi:hypothetical protein
VFKYFITTAAIYFFAANSFSTVQILPYHHNEWKSSWSEVITKSLDNEFLNRDIDEEDLEALNCPDYNYASGEEKKDFWITFFASLARSESGLNDKAKSPSMRGHRSYGLLQLAPETAMNFCNLIFLEEEVLNGEDNLGCGVTLLKWQLNGAPDKSGKMKRPDLENQLFGKKILLWGPLRQNDKHGRKRLYDFFNQHLDQLPFCRL